MHIKFSLDSSPIIMETSFLLDEYCKQLTPLEQTTLAIAKDHLGSSFDLSRSNGFLKWVSTIHASS